MGNEAGGHKRIHISGAGGKLQIGHIGRQADAFFIGAVGNRHGIGAGKAGISDVAEFFGSHIRQHADVYCIFHVDAGADAAGNIDPVDAVCRHIHTSEQGIHPGENGGLGPDEIVDIHLVDGYLPAGFRFLRKSQHIASGPESIPEDPSARTLELAPGIDDAAAVELRNHIDDAAAADACHFLPRLTDDGKGNSSFLISK